MRIQYVPDEQDFAEARAALAGAPYVRSNWKRGLAGWALFVGMCVMLLVLLARRHDSRPRATAGTAPATWRRETLIGMSALGLGVALLAVTLPLLVRHARRAQRRGVPVTVELLSDGVSFSNGLLRVELTWPYLEGFCETPRLFAVREPIGVIRVIRKEAFASGEEREAFGRELRARLTDLGAGAGATS